MARPLRFCFLSIFYPPYSFGGDAIYLHRLANALATRGHEVDIIHCLDSYQLMGGQETEQQFPNHPNVTVHRLRSILGFVSPLLAQQIGTVWPKTDRILEVFYSKKFDVIHYHNISLLGPKVLQLEPDYRDFIKLYTTHEHWLVCPMHVLWKNNERLCEKPECFRCTLKFKRPPQWWRYTSLLEECVRSVDTFIAPTEFTRQVHKQRGFEPPMEVVPHFVPDGNHDLSGEAPSPHPRPYFLFVGRLEKIKGADTLLPIFRQYRSADLLIAGAGNYEGDLRRQAAGMANVHFLGSLPQDRLTDLYRHAIALLVPSVCYETLGMIVVESYVQHTPVIARDQGGLTEIVEQSQGGLLYHSADDLLAAMGKLQTNPILRQTMGDCGYQAFQEKWTESAHLSSYFHVLEDTAQRKLGVVPWHKPSRRSLQLSAVSAA
jgi:glycosyltransferase involved in cell wall biosynthesis